MSLALERTLAALEHPRFVTPAGDRRENAVPCAVCAKPTLAIRGPVCLACEPDEAEA